MISPLLFLLLLQLVSLLVLLQAVEALSALPPKAIAVTGANKGQGFALCQRILEEQDDTYVFLCSRDKTRGEAAVESLGKYQERAEAVVLDVTDPESVQAAVRHIQTKLSDAEPNKQLYGLVSNAGILWGYSLEEQFQVNARGVRNVLDAFLPITKNKMIVVSSGLGPLMHSFASEENQAVMNKDDLTWDDLEELMTKCLLVQDKGPQAFEDIGFSGGPFAEAVPDFHMYGLAKMMADAYMQALGKRHDSLQINSCDPGLVYTDLILKMPKYEGQEIDETGAQTPKEGVEAAMRLLFDDSIEGSGHFYAMNKEKTKFLKSTIKVKPSE